MSSCKLGVDILLGLGCWHLRLSVITLASRLVKSELGLVLVAAVTDCATVMQARILIPV